MSHRKLLVHLIKIVADLLWVRVLVRLFWRNMSVLRREVRKFTAEVAGFGESGDANHITTPAPEGEGAARAMKAALTMANTKIDYINAHGTSTAYNDLFETDGIEESLWRQG